MHSITASRNSKIAMIWYARRCDVGNDEIPVRGCFKTLMWQWSRPKITSTNAICASYTYSIQSELLIWFLFVRLSLDTHRAWFRSQIFNGIELCALTKYQYINKTTNSLINTHTHIDFLTYRMIDGTFFFLFFTIKIACCHLSELSLVE